MRKMSKTAFKKLMATSTAVQCPTADYTGIPVFDTPCNFDRGSLFGSVLFYNNTDAYTAYRFQADCRFGNNVRFQDRCYFEAGCTFGADASFTDCFIGGRCVCGDNSSFTRCYIGSLSKLGRIDRLGSLCAFDHSISFTTKSGRTLESIPPAYTASGYGAVGRTTYGIPHSKGVYVICGCWQGTLKQFRRRVAAQYHDLPLADEYQLVADLFEMRWKRAERMRGRRI